MFDIQGDKIKLSIEALSIPPFKEYYNKRKDKATVLKEIEYVIWLHRWNTPYLAYPPERRPFVVAKDVFNDENYKPSKELAELITRFLEFQNTPLIRLYTAAEEGLEYVIRTLQIYKTYCEDIDVAIKIAKLSKEVEAVAKSVNSAKERAMADQVETGKVKGGGTLGLYEMPR